MQEIKNLQIRISKINEYLNELKKLDPRLGTYGESFISYLSNLIYCKNNNITPGSPDDLLPSFQNTEVMFHDVIITKDLRENLAVKYIVETAKLFWMDPDVVLSLEKGKHFYP